MNDKVIEVRNAYLNEKLRHERTAFGSDADRWTSHERVTAALTAYMNAVRQQYTDILALLSSR